MERAGFTNVLAMAGLVVLGTLVAVVLAAPGEDAPLHDLPAEKPTVDPMDPLPDVDPTAPLPTVNVTVIPSVTPEVETGPRSASWSFDLALVAVEGQERFRFRAADGGMRDGVTVRVTWSEDLPEEPAMLELRPRSGPALVRHADATEGATAVFEVPYADLVELQDGSASWTLRARVPAWDAQVADIEAATWYPYGGLDPAEVLLEDGDDDGRPDDVDNCPEDANPEQANLDGDLRGDVCDDDRDGDTYNNTHEAASSSDPDDFRSTPVDPDGDGFTTEAEQQAQSDPFDARSTPADPDGDRFMTWHEEAAGSDPFDARSTPLDVDADGVPNEQDVCPRTADPMQGDGDADGIGDACDLSPDDGPDGDADGDGVPNGEDACPALADDQTDTDGDGRGDACDSDKDDDGHTDAADAFPLDASEWSDHDADGIGDNADQDDDGDGLTDDEEEARGLDPLAADSDGDRIDDLAEIQAGTDPTDRLSPDFRAQDVHATAREDGTVSVAWTAAHDERVASYRVWRADPFTVVADVEARPEGGAYEAVDPAFPDDDQLYGVQPILAGDLPTLDRATLVTSPLFRVDYRAAAQEAQVPGAPDVPEVVPPVSEDPDPTEEPPRLTEPEKESPTLLLGVSVLALLGAALVRRR